MGISLIKLGDDPTPINDAFTHAGQNLANQFLHAWQAASTGQIGSSRRLGMILGEKETTKPPPRLIVVNTHLETTCNGWNLKITPLKGRIISQTYSNKMTVKLSTISTNVTNAGLEFYHSSDLPVIIPHSSLIQPILDRDISTGQKIPGKEEPPGTRWPPIYLSINLFVLGNWMMLPTTSLP